MIGLLLNPTVRKIAPLLSELGAALGVTGEDLQPEAVDKFVALARRCIPVITALGQVKAADATGADVSSVLNAARVDVDPDLVDWLASKVNELASDPQQSLLDFAKGPGLAAFARMAASKAGRASVLTNPVPETPTVNNNPSYDPISGKFTFE